MCVLGLLVQGLGREASVSWGTTAGGRRRKPGRAWFIDEIGLRHRGETVGDTENGFLTFSQDEQGGTTQTGSVTRGRNARGGRCTPLSIVGTLSWSGPTTAKWRTDGDSFSGPDTFQCHV